MAIRRAWRVSGGSSQITEPHSVDYAALGEGLVWSLIEQVVINELIYAVQRTNGSILNDPLAPPFADAGTKVKRSELVECVVEAVPIRVAEEVVGLTGGENRVVVNIDEVVGRTGDGREVGEESRAARLTCPPPGR